MASLSRGKPFGFATGILFMMWMVVVGMSGNGQASFNVQEDGFSISNSPGYCFAMVAFSRWYYLARESNPPLRKAIAGQAQQKIARELQEFYGRNLIRTQADYCNKHHMNPSESFMQCLIGLVSGDPRIVLLMNKGTKGTVLHAVLAYEWVSDENLLKVYDPNYPHKERFIDLEKRQYTSLDITYNSICFPEVLNNHDVLVKRMERLYAFHVQGNGQRARRGGPVAGPLLNRARTENIAAR